MGAVVSDFSQSGFFYSWVKILNNYPKNSLEPVLDFNKLVQVDVHNRPDDERIAAFVNVAEKVFLNVNCNFINFNLEI